MVSEADGYQPHLIAPEQGYRRLIEGSLNYFKGPAEASVDAVRACYFVISHCYYCDFFCGCQCAPCVLAWTYFFMRRLRESVSTMGLVGMDCHVKSSFFGY